VGVEITRDAEERFVAGSEALESKQGVSRGLNRRPFAVATVPFPVALHSGWECLNRLSFTAGAISLLVVVTGEKETTFCPNLDVFNYREELFALGLSNSSGYSSTANGVVTY
jgi:hypothetical protein